MTDKDILISDLNDISEILNNNGYGGWCKAIRKAVELLKEQEAVEPKTEPSAKGYWFTCGVCGWWLFEVRDTVHFDDRKRIHFCASCGRRAHWE